MAMKKWFRRLQPLQLYALLVLSVGFLLVQLIMSHTTHALTLLMESYHMLCNIIALVGCIITIKYGSANLGNEESANHPADCDDSPVSLSASTSCYFDPSAAAAAPATTFSKCAHAHQNQQHGTNSRERRLKNTFGWARIDVLVMLSGCVFLASLCFSVVIEALQTLVHIKHQDEMHHPIPVMCVGAVGLLLNGLCYLLIGGYTFQQGSFLHVTSSGDVVLDHKVSQKTEGKNTQPPANVGVTQQRQGIWEMCRDVLGCVIMILCAMVVYAIEDDYGKFVDPVLSIVSAILLFALSYPFMKESGYILLQTIPDSINIDSLRADLLKAFPDIINVHDLHVWRLTANKVFSTAHIIFLNAKDYVRITKDVIEFFHDQGITQVTIQPEFFKMDNHSNLTPLPNEHLCLVPCRAPQCVSLHCCLTEEELTGVISTKNELNHLKQSRKQDPVSSTLEPVPHICRQPAMTYIQTVEASSLQAINTTQNKNALHPKREKMDNSSLTEQCVQEDFNEVQNQSMKQVQTHSELQGNDADISSLSQHQTVVADVKERTDIFRNTTQKKCEVNQQSELQGNVANISSSSQDQMVTAEVKGWTDNACNAIHKNSVSKHKNGSVSELCNIPLATNNEKTIEIPKENASKSDISTALQIYENEQNGINISSSNSTEMQKCSESDEALVTRL